MTALDKMKGGVLLRSSLKTIWSSISIHGGEAAWNKCSPMNKIKTGIDSAQKEGGRGLLGAGWASTALILSRQMGPIQGTACTFQSGNLSLSTTAHHRAFQPVASTFWLWGVNSASAPPLFFTPSGPVLCLGAASSQLLTWGSILCFDSYLDLWGPCWNLSLQILMLVSS